jgi:uncharacterized protein (TIGR03437 family)
MSIKLRIAIGVSFAAAAYAQPVVNQGGILNAGSYAIDGAPNAGIAQGSMFVIFGSGMGPAALQQVSSFPLPKTLGGTSVQVTAANGTKVDGVMVYTSAGQVAAILPSNTPTGKATLTVTYNGRASAAATFQVVNTRFGMFTQNSRGNGPAIIQNYNAPADQPLNTLSVSAKPGQAVTLWGTGLGPISGDDAAAPPVGNLSMKVNVLVANKPAKILYQGRSGCCAGIDQIVFETPAGVDGCFAPVVVQANDVAGNIGSMAVASDGQVCSDPTGFSATDIAKAKAQGSIKVGELYLLRFIEPNSGQSLDFGAAEFSKVTYDQIRTWQNPYTQTPAGSCYGASYNSLGQVQVVTGTPDFGFFEDWLPVGDPLDAGPKLNLHGSGGAQSLDRTDPGGYFGLLFNVNPTSGSLTYLTPGTYVFDNGSGGSDVGAFNTSVQIDAPIQWTNLSAAAAGVNRSNDFTLTWTGGGASDRVVVSATAYQIVDISKGSVLGGTVVCTADANAGRLTIPSAYLSLLPAAANDTNSVGLLGLYTSSRSNRFQPNAGLDAAYIVTLGYSFAMASFK